MLAVYLLTLGASAGLTGLFVHQVLAGQGFVPVFEAGVYLAAGVCFLYVTIETAYMLLVRLYKPTKDNAPLFFECLSHLASLALLPYILRMSIPWPLPVLEKNAPLVFLAAFLALHGFFKLLSFFAAMRGLPGSRKGALGWLAAGSVFALAAYVGLGRWVDVLEANRPVAGEAAVRQGVGGRFVQARPVPEGAQFRIDLSQEPGRGIALLWANDPNDSAESISRIHMTAQFEGDSGKRFTKNIRLAKDGWTTIRLRPEDIPQGARACRIVWNAGEEPKWQRFSVLLPVLTSNRRLLVGGPSFWQLRDAATPPNLVVVLVDGLTGHKGPSGTVNAEGWLSSVASLAQIAVVFDNAYTPAPEAPAAIVSLMTGLSPLRHGYLDGRQGSLSPDLPTLAERLRTQGYITAAFASDTAVDAVMENGFDLYSVADGAAANEPSVSVETSDAAPPAVATGVAPTASERALEWTKENADAKYMAFVWLNDLGGLKGKELEGPVVRELDRRLAALLRPLRADGKTAILLASPYGLPAFKADAKTPAERLIEGGLHVPCMLYVPGVQAARHPEVLSLEDLPAVTLNALGGAFPATVGSGEAVSVCGDPLALSIRSDKWRFTWQTELSLAIPTSVPGMGTAALYDVERMRRGSTTNQSLRNKQAAQRLFERLQSYLKAYRSAGN